MLNRKRIMLVVLIILLFAPVAQGGIMSWTIIPGGQYQYFSQGYWENSAGSTGYISNDGGIATVGYFNIIRSALGDTDKIYLATKTGSKTDLNDTSYISLYFERNSTCNGNITLGVDDVSRTTATMDKRIDSTSDGKQTIKLNVGDLYDAYWIKFGGDTTTSAFGGYIRTYIYNITLHNYSYSYPKNATAISTTTATLNGYLVNDSGTNIEGGFLLYNTSLSVSSHGWNNYEHNFSASGTYTTGNSFSASATTLSPGQYYYVRSWSFDGCNYNLSENETYFLTKPAEPTNFRTIQQAATSITLAWTNATVGNTSNHSVLIHYSTSSPPGGAIPSTWGTFGANESTWNYATVSGLAQDTTYYFVGWTYVNNSGSPTLSHFSDSFATTSNFTEGGIYNISVRYENESNSGNLPVDLSIWGQHKFVIHTTTFSSEVIFDDGICTYTGDMIGYFGDNSSGNFTIELNETILWIDFYWNYSNNSMFRCTRSHVVLTGERNITFYVRTDLPVYGTTTYKEVHSDTSAVVNPANPVTITTSYQINEVYGVYVYNASIYGGWVQVGSGNYTANDFSVTVSDDVLDANSTLVKVEYYTYSVVAGTTDIIGTLVQYTYTFKDASTMFVDAEELNAYAEIYYYNDSSVKQIIHREFLSANDEVYPMLVYDKKYRIGVGLLSDASKRIELVGLAPTGTNPTPESIEIPQTVADNYSFFEVIDLDVGWSAGGSGLYVYYQDVLYGTNNVSFQVFAYNHTLVYSENSTAYNKNFTYPDADYNTTYTINITTNHSVWTTNISITFQMFGRIAPITDITSLNNLLEKIFGNTPLQNFETGETIPWTYILVGTIAFIIMMSLGYINAYVGMMGTGLWLTASPSFITGVPIQFAIVGVFLIAMSIIFALGGKQ